MKLAMITLNDEAYEPLAAITYHQNKVPYCIRHGYEMLQKKDDFSYPDPYLGFEKSKFILDTFRDRPYLDWIHASGCDLMVTNHLIRLENLVDDNYHMIVCFDANGMNVDSFLIRNSRIGRGIMQYVLDSFERYKNHYWFEQQSLIDFYFNVPLAKEYIKILPQRYMNSYIYDLYPEWKDKPHIDKTGNNGDWKPGDFMLHLPGTKLQQRIEIMTEFLEKVIK